MTAYELADSLQETEPYYSTDYKLFDKTATMLRQQANRIAELEKQLGIFDAELMKSRISNSLMKTDRDRLADRIAELEYKNELLVNRLEVITGVRESKYA